MAQVFTLFFVNIFTDHYLQPGDYSLAISLAASGKVDLKPLVSHR